MPVDRALIFAAAKRRGAVFRTRADVADMDAAIDAAWLSMHAKDAPPPVAPPLAHGSAGRRVSPKGIALIHSFEQCKLAAYPDPGSKDGNPWTIGWGSTGPDIRRGTVWTQEQADARFAADLADFSAKVAALVDGVPTNQNQFDAMVCLAYNIGIGSTNPALKGGLTRSTVLKLHRAGDYLGAARAFLMWNKNDGQVMRGLTRRRLAEADLYDDPVEQA